MHTYIVPLAPFRGHEVCVMTRLQSARTLWWHSPILLSIANSAPFMAACSSLPPYHLYPHISLSPITLTSPVLAYKLIYSSCLLTVFLSFHLLFFFSVKIHICMSVCMCLCECMCACACRCVYTPQSQYTHRGTLTPEEGIRYPPSLSGYSFEAGSLPES